MNHTIVAVFIQNGKLLMNQRDESRKLYAGYLMCPSGHIENNETFEEALRREMKEELGIEIHESKFLFTIDDTDPFSGLGFRHNFMLAESYEGKIEKSKEGDLIWMPYSELTKAQLAPIVNKLVEKLREMNLIGK